MAKIEVRLEGIVFNGSGELLLAQHRKKGKAYWVLPGGHLEFCESMENGLLRELDEELGLSNGEVKELWFLDEYISSDPPRHNVKAGFLARYPEEELENVKVIAGNEAIKDARFFSAIQIEESADTFYPTREFYLRILERRNG